MAKELEKAHLHAAERLLTAYYTRFSLGNALSPKATSPKRPETTFFGGLLNNKNDPGRRKPQKGSISLFKQHSPSESRLFREVSCMDLDFLPLFTRNSSYRLKKQLGSTVKTHSRQHQSEPEVTVPAENCLSAAGIRLKPKQKKQPTRRRNPRLAKPLLISTAVDTEGSKDPYPLTTSSSVASLCLSPTARRQSSPVSQYLDRLVRRQAFQRYIGKETRAKPVVRVKSPQTCTRPKTQADWQTLAVLGAKTRNNLK